MTTEKNKVYNITLTMLTRSKHTVKAMNQEDATDLALAEFMQNPAKQHSVEYEYQQARVEESANA